MLNHRSSWNGSRFVITPTTPTLLELLQAWGNFSTLDQVSGWVQTPVHYSNCRWWCKSVLGLNDEKLCDEDIAIKVITKSDLYYGDYKFVFLSFFFRRWSVGHVWRVVGGDCRRWSVGHVWRVWKEIAEDGVWDMSEESGKRLQKMECGTCLKSLGRDYRRWSVGHVWRVLGRDCRRWSVGHVWRVWEEIAEDGVWDMSEESWEEIAEAETEGCGWQSLEVEVGQRAPELL